jgi:hypothetical protein
MTSPLIHAFFLGRATAELIYEGMENTLTDALSEVGKFDAEQRERLRYFTTQVIERANRQEGATVQSRSTAVGTAGMSQPADLQVTIDDLRAEIARLRSELQHYRNRSV